MSWRPLRQPLIALPHQPLTLTTPAFKTTNELSALKDDKLYLSAQHRILYEYNLNLTRQTVVIFPNVASTLNFMTQGHHTSQRLIPTLTTYSDVDLGMKAD
jgi:hypothetical protein